jgi:hypothetical protein
MRHGTTCKHAPYSHGAVIDVMGSISVSITSSPQCACRAAAPVSSAAAGGAACAMRQSVCNCTPAAQLPRLRSLDLRLHCCSATRLHDSTDTLGLTAATRLTELLLRLSTTHPDAIQRLQMPPHLQVLQHGCMLQNWAGRGFACTCSLWQPSEELCALHYEQ